MYRYLAIFFLIFSPIVNALDTQTGIDWLIEQQQADGRIASELTRPEQATVESILTFTELSQAELPAITAGKTYLDSTNSQSTEVLALLALAEVNQSITWQAVVKQRQNRNGGIGAHDGYGSDIVSTAAALRALAKTTPNDMAAAQALGYLLSIQKSDGGWSFEDNHNDIELTALAVDALWHYRQQYNLSDAIDKGVQFLADQRGANGLWRNTEASALALSTLYHVVVDRTPYSFSFEQFKNLFDTSGSLEEDTYLTALGLRVLHRGTQLAADDIQLKGRVVDGDTNRPLSNISVELTGTENLQQTTDSNGQFNWTGLLPGNYQLSIALNGYSPITANIQLNIGDQRDYGDLNLIKGAAGANVATVMGRVATAEGDALAGVTVSVAGQTITTNNEGQYQFVNVTPGQIQLQAFATGYATAIASVTTVAGQTFLFSPVLQPLGNSDVTVGGQVTDRETLQPLANVDVIALGGGSRIETTTDSDGRYTITGLQAGNIALQASLSGYMTAGGSAVTVAGTHINFSPLLVAEGAEPTPVSNSGITGVVVDRLSGFPLANVLVTLQSNDQNITALTNTAGEFTFTGLTPAETDVQFTLAGYQPAVTNILLQENFTLSIGEIQLLEEGITLTSTIEGTVVNSRTNEPLANVTIEGQFESGTLTVTADENGYFSIPDVSDSEGNMAFTLEGFYTSKFYLALEPGNDLDVGQIRLRPEDVVELLPDLTLNNLTSEIETDLNTLDIVGFIHVDLTNQGNAKTENTVTVLAYHDSNLNGQFDTATDQVLGKTQYSDNLAVDEHQPITIPVTGKLPFRQAPIEVWVDSELSIIELDENNNTASTANKCQMGQCDVGTADSKEFEPKLKWRWDLESVTTIPLVFPLFDSNFDGAVDSDDDAAIIFASRVGGVDRPYATLRAIDARTKEELWAVSEIDGEDLRTEGRAHPAIGDIDGDGLPEIVMFLRDGRVAALNNDGSLLWITKENVRQPTDYNLNYGAITLADIDGDGSTEILARAHVFNNSGKLLWKVDKEPPFTAADMAVDLDMDGKSEVIIGNQVYRSDGAFYCELTNKTIIHTGFGNFDDDEFPEIVAIGSNVVYLFGHDCEEEWPPQTIPSNTRFGGAPKIADVDGDGRAEIIYADELRLRVYDGQTLGITFEIDNRSSTATEYPIVADIDGDNHAELMVVSDGGTTMGIRAFEDTNDSWVNTRRIWNQYHSHIDNVNDDGSIPAQSAYSWQTHNTFRFNTFPSCSSFVENHSSLILDFDDVFDTDLLTFNGSATTYSNNTSEAAMRLTPALSGQSGSVFTTEPIALVDSKGFNASFSTSFAFRISNSNGNHNDSDGAGADGLVFTIQTNSNSVGSTGLGIGYQGIPNSVGIEFDTYDNSPANGFSQNDVSGNHVGIDINGNIDSIAQIPITERLNNGGIWHTWIDYNGVTDLLEVRLSQTAARPASPILSIQIDLVEVLGVEDAYIGFTSGTGASWGNHDILSWQFANRFAPIGERSDLTLSQLTVTENDNALLVASARIGNASVGASPDGAFVRFYLGNPDTGTSLGEVVVPSLSPGEFVDIQFPDITGIASGATITAFVDPDNNLVECDEDNNSMDTVVTGLKGAIALSLDTTLLMANSTLNLTTSVTNSGVLGAAYSTTLTITDSNGAVVNTFTPHTVAALAAGGTTDFSDHWNNGFIVAGSYRATATLLDSAGQPIASAEAPFTIGNVDANNLGVQLRTATDKTLYGNNDTVIIDNLVKNLSPNTAHSGSQLRTVVRAPDGDTLLYQTDSINTIAIAAEQQVFNTVSLSQASEGDYTVTAELIDNKGNLLTTDSAAFKVNTEVSVAVGVTARALEPTVAQGQRQSCLYGIKVKDSTVINTLTLESRVTHIADQTEFNHQTTVLDFSTSAEKQMEHLVQTLPLKPGTYACVLTTELDSESVVLATAFFEVTEAEQPDIQFTCRVLTAVDPHLLIWVDDITGEEPGGSSQQPSLAAQQQALQTALQTSQLEAQWVTSATAFEQALLTGHYNQYLLLQENAQPSQALQQWLAQQVYRGHGLVLSKPLIEKDYVLSQIAGVRTQQAQPQSTLLNVFAEPYNSIAANVSLIAADPIHSFHLNGAHTVGNFVTDMPWQYEADGSCAISAGAPALLTHGYGQGQVVTTGFDWALNAAISDTWMSLLQTSITQTANRLLTVSTQQPTSITVHIHSDTGGSGRMRLVLPPALQLVEAEGWQTTGDGQWYKSIMVAEGASVVETISVQAVSAGDYPLSVTLDTEGAQGYTPYTTLDKTLRFTDVPTLPALVAALATAQQTYSADPWLALAAFEANHLLVLANNGQTTALIDSLNTITRLLQRSNNPLNPEKTALATYYWQTVQASQQGGAE
ncbi:carboxypeptidase regulatory-like domain-containing protein [Teredinibacter turnerae]|uniref:carboxypeptidase regulatory-like domain-containing protein n=1 Tax=Teredinibacter turnerae TaxID=2426 RepID=UPI0003753FB4|nr:carboxypeptidase regulatory-like domain-containing protein [Teredinibacter turnerae]